MKNAIILHGTTIKGEYYSDAFPALSNTHWLPWIQKQLLIKDIFAVTPEIPNAWKIDYDAWKKEVERFEITEETILIGYSCGGGFFIRWLSENNIKIKKLILVAPWIDPNKTEGGENNFFNFVWDRKLLEKVKDGITLFSSTNDMESVRKSVEVILYKIENIKLVEFKNYEHFCFGDLKTEKFPELLREVLNNNNNK